MWLCVIPNNRVVGVCRCFAHMRCCFSTLQAQLSFSTGLVLFFPILTHSHSSIVTRGQRGAKVLAVIQTLFAAAAHDAAATMHTLPSLVVSFRPQGGASTPSSTLDCRDLWLLVCSVVHVCM
jgi:hypothetical protein